MPKIRGKSNNSFPSEIEVELQLYYLHINCPNYSDIWLQYLEEDFWNVWQLRGSEVLFKSNHQAVKLFPHSCLA